MSIRKRLLCGLSALALALAPLSASAADEATVSATVQEQPTASPVDTPVKTEPKPTKSEEPAPPAPAPVKTSTPEPTHSPVTESTVTPTDPSSETATTTTPVETTSPTDTTTSSSSSSTSSTSQTAPPLQADISVSGLSVVDGVCSFIVSSRSGGWIDGLDVDETIEPGGSSQYDLNAGHIYEVTIVAANGSTATKHVDCREGSPTESPTASPTDSPTTSPTTSPTETTSPTTAPGPVVVRVTTPPSMKEVCGPDNDRPQIVGDKGYLLRFSGWSGGKSTVTAEAMEGYLLEGRKVWRFVDEDTPCAPPTSSPTVTPTTTPTDSPTSSPTKSVVVPAGALTVKRVTGCAYFVEADGIEPSHATWYITLDGRKTRPGDQVLRSGHHQFNLVVSEEVVDTKVVRVETCVVPTTSPTSSSTPTASPTKRSATMTGSMPMSRGKQAATGVEDGGNVGLASAAALLIVLVVGSAFALRRRTA